jgi:hypothetical protein
LIIIIAIIIWRRFQPNYSEITGGKDARFKKLAQKNDGYVG